MVFRPHSTEESTMSGAKLISFTTFFAGLVLVASLARGQQPMPTVIKIYENIPDEAVQDTRDETEKHFQPFFVFPKDAVSRVSLTDRFSVRQLYTTGEGTCCEFSFKLGGADWFGGVKFIPGGKDPGERQGLNINDHLRLGE